MKISLPENLGNFGASITLCTPCSKVAVLLVLGGQYWTILCGKDNLKVNDQYEILPFFLTSHKEVHCKHLQPVYSLWLCSVCHCNLAVIVTGNDSTHDI